MEAREIRYRLKEKGITQETLAKRWRVRPPTVTDVINGRITSARLERNLARVLGVKAKELRGGRKKT